MNFQTYQEAREYYANKYPQLSEVILNEDNCFSEIFRKAIELGFGAEQIEDFRTAYWWVRRFPEDKDKLIDKITDSRTAYWWATDFPQDKDKLIDKITESKYAYLWAVRFPEDKDKLIDKITSLEYAYLWVERFPKYAAYFKEKVF